MKNWTEAQRYCRESYTDLATVHSMVEMKELTEAIKSSSISQRSVWIGLRRGNTKKWMWSMADARFYKEGEAEFRRWRSGAPSDSADKDCAMMHQDGFWNESSCSQLNRYVCYNGETDNYLSYPDVKNWREAQRFCREHYTDLVSMRNEFENSAFVATIWIGLFRDSWTWSDQSDSSFRYWTSDQPDNLHGGENCTAVRTNGSDFGQWEDLGCGQQLPFVCSKSECLFLEHPFVYDPAFILTSKRAPESSELKLLLFFLLLQRTPVSLPLRSLPTCVPHYHFINEMKNWTEAQRYCRESYTDLVTVHSMVEMKELNKAIKSSSISQRSVWIGLRRGNTKKWMWSMADARFYKEGEAEFRRWRSGAPSDSADKDCAMMHQDGFWNESSCSQLNRYVCYNGETDNYLSYPDVKNWREAQRFCREQHTDLVSMRNEFENSASVATIWIGLFRDSWTWSDQSDSSFRYWTSDQPDNLHGGENCTAVRTNGSDFGQWEDLGCGQQLPFVCSKSESNSSVSPSPKVTTASPDSHKETPTQSAPPTTAPETQPTTNHVFLVRENMTWREALRHCRDHYVDLVSVHSETIQRWVMEVAGKASTSHVWLGLRHTCSQGIWYWIQPLLRQLGSRFRVRSGGLQRRGTGAVQVGGNQQWVSLPESQRLNFICTNYEV
ncbi:hypothetical protein NFI96_028394 [Prochilodus magdalenae]|nr:hypothetical protein NFI96_028394 [Prochilodus magdalenae]